jgi:predicted nucleotide-binding protein
MTKLTRLQARHFKNVFIVHGHDTKALDEVKFFLREVKLNPIVLQEKVTGGNILFKEFQKHSSKNVGFAIVLYTPCDIGAKNGDEKNLRPRARQNVILEHGYLISSLSVENVCALVKGNVEQPSDLGGIIYVRMDSTGNWKEHLKRQLEAVGLIIW